MLSAFFQKKWEKSGYSINFIFLKERKILVLHYFSCFSAFLGKENRKKICFVFFLDFIFLKNQEQSFASKEKVLVRVVKHVGVPSEIVRGSPVALLCLPLPYFLKAIEFLSFVLVELGDDVGEGSF